MFFQQSLQPCWVGLTFSKKDPVGKGWVYGTWTSDILANETIDFNPKLQISKIQRNSQRIYPEPLVLSRFFEETSQSFEFFSNTQNLKLLSSEVLMKAQHTGFAWIWKFSKTWTERLQQISTTTHPVVYRARKRCGLFMASLLKQTLHLVSGCDPAHMTATPMVSPFLGFTRVRAQEPPCIMKHGWQVVRKQFFRWFPVL